MAVGVFLSHSTADKVFARRLGSDLRAQGAKVWIDEAEIKVGDSLIDKISEGIRDTDYLVVALSKVSVQSEWVRREVNIALTQEIHGRRVKVLPCLIEDCDLPLFLLDKKYADFRTSVRYPSGRAELFKALGLEELKLQDRFLNHYVFHDLTDLNSGFDVPTIRYLSAEDFSIALDRFEALGIGVYGIEPWQNGEFYDVSTFEEYGADPFDPSWYKRAFQQFANSGENLQYAASLAVPDSLIRRFLR